MTKTTNDNLSVVNYTTTHVIHMQIIILLLLVAASCYTLLDLDWIRIEN